MDPCELAAFITATAVLISKDIPDDDELGLLAASLTQLGDTLATIAVQRGLIEKRNQAASEQDDDT